MINKEYEFKPGDLIEINEFKALLKENTKTSHRETLALIEKVNKDPNSPKAKQHWFVMVVSSTEKNDVGVSTVFSESYLRKHGTLT